MKCYQSKSLLRDLLLFFVFVATAPSGPWLPHSQRFYITLNDTPQSVGLLWMSDQLVAETFPETEIVKFPIE